MSYDAVIDIVQQAVMTVIIVAAPPLLMGLVVGVIVSIFQTITSIQEPTLAFVPKIVAVLFSLIIFGHFMLNTLVEYVHGLFDMIPTFLQG